MARPEIPEHLRKTKTIKIMVTEAEFKKYQTAKNRLLNHSPTLHAYDILKYCVAQVDDIALLEFLRLDKEDPIRIKLANDYLMSRLDNNIANKDK